jgi:hypothetical protein
MNMERNNKEKQHEKKMEGQKKRTCKETIEMKKRKRSEINR